MPLKQRLVFTLMMCIGMGSIMSWLGMVTSTGLSATVMHQFWLQVLPTIAFAYVFNLLIATNLAALAIKLGTRRLTDTVAIMKRAQTIRGWVMIVVMCLTMSTRALIMTGALYQMTPLQFGLGFIESLIMALIVRDFFVKPVTRRLTASLAN
ncbi:hypothetical protein [Lactiplantibacillus mudanjiangensis]|uniref:DUF2798 domain-containing protein n=1 Tax=Lactiplantibacillus mudanjiangensis TaxID=1296538 RepID=A0A660E7M1_9LACO|nr:hypothetical protein [Lactiplantibacillus mudanjiangensis]VDG25526.1 hypothetical protein [Lactobacillus sp. CBA3605] [Lactiplantibacillus mudanjiangensis]VDG29138.1 hypothetical protein [Lactobacillus sp. CBA3605] [Lactiplantibacillus mudanjiangensis]VDG31658.1 hypothetical protein [Lactobacillus sp. CBA3605] [Lactiplantibacillus mudanjiangensis]